MNLSETAFVVESNVADFGARYFTPGGEIPMAGHPTIATVFALAESGRLALKDNHTRISLELRVGPIPIDVQSTRGKATLVTMSQSFVAEQGHWMNRPGEATVEVVGSRKNIGTVRVGGTAVTVLDGELRI